MFTNQWWTGVSVVFNNGRLKLVYDTVVLQEWKIETSVFLKNERLEKRGLMFKNVAGNVGGLNMNIGDKKHRTIKKNVGVHILVWPFDKHIIKECNIHYIFCIYFSRMLYIKQRM